MTDQLPADIAEAIERACKLAGLFSASLWPDTYHDRATLSCHYNEARASLDAVILKHLRATDLGRSALADEGRG